MDWITQIFMHIVSYIDTVVGGNQFASGAILTGLSGIGLYLAKNIPLNIWTLMIKQTTTSITFNSSVEFYTEFCRYLSEAGLAAKSRTLKVNEYRENDTFLVTASVGFGQHIFWVNWYSPILIEFKVETESLNYRPTEFCKISKFGRGHAFFDQLFERCRTSLKSTELEVYMMRDGSFSLSSSSARRGFNTVFISKKLEMTIIDGFALFISNENWYLKHCIPWRFGMLLYGPPGTGKTSIIKAIASKLELPICIVSNIKDLDIALRWSTKNITVIEEVDLLCKDLDARTTKSETIINQTGSYSINNILNMLDGINTYDGRIIIMTTNHIEKLDDALIRPGRVDLKLEIGYMNIESFNMMILSFYPEYKSTNCSVISKLTPATVQNYIQKNHTLSEVLTKFTTNENNCE